MALHDDELNRRRERREELRKKREREQKRLKIALIAAAVVLVACAVGLFLLIRGGGQDGTASVSATQPAPTQPTKPSEETRPQNAWVTPNTVIHIKAAGDLNITDSVVASGLVATGYDFTRPFMDVAPLLADADLTVLNLEGNICGQPYGTERTSAPAELLNALRCAGVDMLQMANSCSINNGLIGLRSTLQAIRNAGLEPLGAFSSTDEFQEAKGYTICNVQGVKIAFVAFTKGVGGLGMPSGSESCVNMLYTDYATEYKKVDTDGITRILKNAQAEKPDIIVALLHWGSEGLDTISDTQERIVSLMKKNGVDVIIGSHPHRVHEIDYDQAAGTLIAYSLGDFYGDATAGGSNYSVILDVEITKDHEAGTTRVTGFTITPIYTLKEDQCADGDRRVVRIAQAMYAYENNFVDSITKACYEDMAYSLGRIQERTDPPEVADANSTLINRNKEKETTAPPETTGTTDPTETTQ